MTATKPTRLEVQFDAPKAFALAITHTLDGDHIAAENVRKIQMTEESEKLQTQFV